VEYGVAAASRHRCAECLPVWNEKCRDVSVNEDEMRKRLEGLKVEHRDLDAAIDALSSTVTTDQLQIARLKKRKLRLKDQITQIEDYLIPDIIA
jgi:hypothetical protein